MARHFSFRQFLRSTWVYFCSILLLCTFAAYVPALAQEASPEAEQPQGAADLLPTDASGQAGEGAPAAEAPEAEAPEAPEAPASDSPDPAPQESEAADLLPTDGAEESPSPDPAASDETPAPADNPADPVVSDGVAVTSDATDPAADATQDGGSADKLEGDPAQSPVPESGVSGESSGVDTQFRSWFEYTEEEEEALRLAVAEVLTWVSADMTDVQKAQAIHDYLVTHIEYDYANGFNGPHMGQDAYDALVTGTCLCAGYSMAYQICLEQLGIPCVRVYSEDHQWNKIYVDGCWYNVDVTWDDPPNTIIRYDFFLISDQTIATIDTTGDHSVVLGVMDDYHSWGNPPCYYDYYPRPVYTYAGVPSKGTCDMGDADITLGELTYTYTGEPVCPEPTVVMGGVALIRDVDYTLSYSNNVDSGMAEVKITGIGNYTGSRTLWYTIRKVPHGQFTASLQICTYHYGYTGLPNEPDVIAKVDGKILQRDVDYTVSYENNVEIGTGRAWVVFKNYGEGYRYSPTSFTIEEPRIVLSETVYDYTGQPVEPTAVLYLGSRRVPNKSTTLTYENNVEPGIATVTATASGYYGGWTSTTFEIRKRVQLAPENVTLPAIGAEYTGSPAELPPVVTVDGVTLVEGQDYTVSYANNVEPGTATVTVTGIGSYEGTVEANYLVAILFPDTPIDSWYVKNGYLNYVVQHGYMSGYTGSGLFGPYNSLTRAQVATVLYRLATKDFSSDTTAVSSFTDVADGAWYTRAIEWCRERGIVTGYTGSTNFGPNDPVTRQQLATMLYRLAKYMGIAEEKAYPVDMFADSDQIASWARNAVGWCYQVGILTGVDDGTSTATPNDNAQRCQLAKMITVFDMLI